MIAHRGVSGIELENTPAAFIAAGNRSYYGIEADIRKTKDGQYIIFHDPDTVRLADEKLVISDSNFKALRRIALKDQTGKSRIDLRIPSLEEYLSLCKKYEKVSVLELKEICLDTEIEQIIQIVQQEYDLSHVVFISFKLENLIALKQALPSQPAQFLTSSFTQDLVDTLHEHSLDLAIRYTALEPEALKTLQATGIKVNIWTCDDQITAEKFANLGVDFITSNILE